MEKIAPIILELNKIRNIPQYYFCHDIYFGGVVKLREDVLKFKKENPLCEEIDFILCSQGGIADFAYIMIRTLRDHFKNVNIIVPFFAKSAATLLALGGTQIIMDELGEFGPIDVQIPRERDDNPIDYEDRESALIDEISLENIEERSHRQFHKMFVSVFQNIDIPVNKNELTTSLLTYLSDFYKPLLGQIKTYQIGEKNRKLDIGYKYANRILIQYTKIDEDKRKDLVQFLVHDCPHHGYILDYKLMKPFLPDVIKMSSEISEDYKNKLQELSLTLTGIVIKTNLTRYQGFIEPVKKNAPAGKAKINKNINPEPEKNNTSSSNTSKKIKNGQTSHTEAH